MDGNLLTELIEATVAKHVMWQAATKASTLGDNKSSELHQQQSKAAEDRIKRLMEQLVRIFVGDKTAVAPTTVKDFTTLLNTIVDLLSGNARNVGAAITTSVERTIASPLYSRIYKDGIADKDAPDRTAKDMLASLDKVAKSAADKDLKGNEVCLGTIGASAESFMRLVFSSLKSTFPPPESKVSAIPTFQKWESDVKLYLQKAGDTTIRIHRELLACLNGAVENQNLPLMGQHGKGVATSNQWTDFVYLVEEAFYNYQRRSVFLMLWTLSLLFAGHNGVVFDPLFAIQSEWNAKSKKVDFGITAAHLVDRLFAIVKTDVFDQLTTEMNIGKLTSVLAVNVDSMGKQGSPKTRIKMDKEVQQLVQVLRDAIQFCGKELETRMTALSGEYEKHLTAPIPPSNAALTALMEVKFSTDFQLEILQPGTIAISLERLHAALVEKMSRDAEEERVKNIAMAVQANRVGEKELSVQRWENLRLGIGGDSMISDLERQLAEFRSTRGAANKYSKGLNPEKHAKILISDQKKNQATVSIPKSPPSKKQGDILSQRSALRESQRKAESERSATIIPSSKVTLKTSFCATSPQKVSSGVALRSNSIERQPAPALKQHTHVQKPSIPTASSASKFKFSLSEQVPQNTIAETPAAAPKSVPSTPADEVTGTSLKIPTSATSAFAPKATAERKLATPRQEAVQSVQSSDEINKLLANAEEAPVMKTERELEVLEVKKKYPFLLSEPCPGVYLEDLDFENDPRFRASVNRLMMEKMSFSGGATQRKKLEALENSINDVIKFLAEEAQQRTLETVIQFPSLPTRIDGVLLSNAYSKLEEDEQFQALKRTKREGMKESRQKSVDDCLFERAQLVCSLVSASISKNRSEASIRALKEFFDQAQASDEKGNASVSTVGSSVPTSAFVSPRDRAGHDCSLKNVGTSPSVHKEAGISVVAVAPNELSKVSSADAISEKPVAMPVSSASKPKSLVAKATETVKVESKIAEPVKMPEANAQVKPIEFPVVAPVVSISAPQTSATPIEQKSQPVSAKSTSSAQVNGGACVANVREERVPEDRGPVRIGSARPPVAPSTKQPVDFSVRPLSNTITVLSVRRTSALAAAAASAANTTTSVPQKIEEKRALAADVLIIEENEEEETIAAIKKPLETEIISTPSKRPESQPTEPKEIPATVLSPTAVTVTRRTSDLHTIEPTARPVAARIPTPMKSSRKTSAGSRPTPTVVKPVIVSPAVVAPVAQPTESKQPSFPPKPDERDLKLDSPQIPATQAEEFSSEKPAASVSTTQKEKYDDSRAATPATEEVISPKTASPPKQQRPSTPRLVTARISLPSPHGTDTTKQKASTVPTAPGEHGAAAATASTTDRSPRTVASAMSTAFTAPQSTRDATLHGAAGRTEEVAIVKPAKPAAHAEKSQTPPLQSAADVRNMSDLAALSIPLMFSTPIRKAAKGEDTPTMVRSPSVSGIISPREPLLLFRRPGGKSQPPSRPRSHLRKSPEDEEDCSAQKRGSQQHQQQPPKQKTPTTVSQPTQSPYERAYRALQIENSLLERIEMELDAAIESPLKVEDLSGTGGVSAITTTAPLMKKPSEKDPHLSIVARANTPPVITAAAADARPTTSTDTQSALRHPTSSGTSGGLLRATGRTTLSEGATPQSTVLGLRPWEKDSVQPRRISYGSAGVVAAPSTGATGVGTGAGVTLKPLLSPPAPQALQAGTIASLPSGTARSANSSADMREGDGTGSGVLSQGSSNNPSMWRRGSRNAGVGLSSISTSSASALEKSNPPQYGRWAERRGPPPQVQARLSKSRPDSQPAGTDVGNLMGSPESDDWKSATYSHAESVGGIRGGSTKPASTASATVISIKATTTSPQSYASGSNRKARSVPSVRGRNPREYLSIALSSTPPSSTSTPAVGSPAQVSQISGTATPAAERENVRLEPIGKDQQQQRQHRPVISSAVRSTHYVHRESDVARGPLFGPQRTEPMTASGSSSGSAGLFSSQQIANLNTSLNGNTSVTSQSLSMRSIGSSQRGYSYAGGAALGSSRSAYDALLRRQAEQHEQLMRTSPLPQSLEIQRYRSPRRSRADAGAEDSSSVSGRFDSVADSAAFGSRVAAATPTPLDSLGISPNQTFAATYGAPGAHSPMAAGRPRPFIVFGVGVSLSDVYVRACQEFNMRPNSGLLRTFPSRPGDYMEKLDLSVNYVGTKGFQPILYVLERNRNFLQFLSLSNNNLENLEAVELVEVLMKGEVATRLSHLDISYNPISQAGGQALLRLCASHPNLVSIKLKGTLIPPKLMQTIVDKVEDNAYRKHIGMT